MCVIWVTRKNINGGMVMKYSENGFWVKPIDTGYRIGLSAKGQDDLGDIGFFELLATEVLSTQEAFIAVEASKAVTDLTAPVNADIVAVNERLNKSPELLNSTDINDNWIVDVTLHDEQAYEALMDTDSLKA